MNQYCWFLQERISLQRQYIRAFLSGEQLPEAVSKKPELLKSMQEFLEQLGQAPSVRTTYWRTAFQQYDSNAGELPEVQGLGILIG